MGYNHDSEEQMLAWENELLNQLETNYLYALPETTPESDTLDLAA